MRQIRIHIAQALRVDTEVALSRSAIEHVGRVLRLRSGDALTLFNGDGSDYAAQLTEVTRNSVRAQVNSAVALDNESHLSLTLAQGIARGDKMDWVVQKATELGVTRIVPLHSERSEVRLDDHRAARRIEHWRAVAISACEQCGRARIPAIDPVTSVTSWCDGLDDDNALRVALLPGASQRVHDLTATEAGVILVVGPEGGLGERDMTTLTAAGFGGINLGPRILRSETAGLVALAALQTAFGDL